MKRKELVSEANAASSETFIGPIRIRERTKDHRYCDRVLVAGASQQGACKPFGLEMLNASDFGHLSQTCTAEPRCGSYAEPRFTENCELTKIECGGLLGVES